MTLALRPVTPALVVPGRMTLIARLRVIAVPGHARVLLVHSGLRVAVHTAKGACAARCMTFGARQIVRARQRKCMLERGRDPGGNAVALLTGVREALSHMAGRRLVVGGVTGVAGRRNWPEDAACVATDAIHSRVPAGEREEILTHKCPLPAERQVTAMTIGGPSAGGVIRRGGARQVRPVAQVTLDRSPAKLAGGGSRVTALTGRRRVGSKQWKPRPGMLGDQSGRSPTGLLVAALTVQTQRRGVRVGVTSAAAPGGKGRHRAAIVVASQARRPGVRALERLTRLLLVIEGKILAQDVPSVGAVADSAIAGKCRMRHEGSPSAAPPLPWGIQPAIDQRHCRDRREQSENQYSGPPVVLPHHIHRDNAGIGSQPVRRPHPTVLSCRMPRGFTARK